MTREELYKIAKHYAQDELKDSHSAVEDVVAAAFIDGVNYADAHPHWISVEDELPKKNGRYLVFNGITKDQEIFVYSNGIWWYNADRIPNMIVSHWMHLPQPPKEGGTQ